jgi:hypothetical protein
LPNTAKKFKVDEKVVKVMICHFVKSKMTACLLQQKNKKRKTAFEDDLQSKNEF